MSITIKNEEEIKIMRESGQILAEALERTLKQVKPGISTWELDKFAEEFILSKGAKPAFKGYQGFPGTLCTAINEVIVHGIPRKDEFLKEGDLFTIDCGVLYKGFNTDAARSIGVGKISEEKERLLKTAKMALSKAIDLAKPGTHIGELSKVIQETIENSGFKVIHDLTGHGIGKALHEDPIILNYNDGNLGPMLKAGMTVAIEPIFSVSTSEMTTLSDGWTIITSDRSCSVQQENTILITKNSCEVLTEK